MGVENKDPVTPPVTHEDALVMDVVGDGQRNLNRGGSYRIEFAGIEVRLAENPTRVPVLYAVLPIELPYDNTIVVLVDREQAMVNRVENDITRIDILRRGTIVGRASLKVRMPFVVQMPDHLDGRHAGTQSLGRNIPDNGAVSAWVALSGDEQLAFGID